MPEIHQHINLKTLNTFGIEAFAKYYCEVGSVSDFLDLIHEPTYTQNNKLIIGGGSNLLFTRDFDGLVIKNNIKNISIVSENENEIYIKAGAGEVWHDFVVYCINKGYGGLENLSLIPGCVGASPMQNIGAYGVEIKDVFHELEAYDMETGELRIFSKEDCAFGYRESVFKNKYKNRYLIAAVIYRLKKQPELNTSYGAINTELQAMGVKEPGIREVSQAVINIRQSKLPDPKVTGNAGSFFKNPEISAEKMEELKKQFPGIVSYALPNGHFKLAAGWMIEQCGLKGFSLNGAAVHQAQALVLINQHACSGDAVFKLSQHVMLKVLEKFGVQLEREVNII